MKLEKYYMIHIHYINSQKSVLFKWYFTFWSLSAFFTGSGILFQACTKRFSEIFAWWPLWSGWGKIMFAFERVIGPGCSNEQCAKSFHAEHCREYSTISSTDGIRNFFLIAVISAYPYFGMPTIARIPALHAVCNSFKGVMFTKVHKRFQQFH